VAEAEPVGGADVMGRRHAALDQLDRADDQRRDQPGSDVAT
jgi:hypothetical protein